MAGNRWLRWLQSTRSDISRTARSGRRSKRALAPRRPLLESLEPRQLLSVTSGLPDDDWSDPGAADQTNVGMTIGPAAPPTARNFYVNSTVDAPDDRPGDGRALTAAGETTLRAAVMEANALAGASIINVSAGYFVFTQVGDDDAAAVGDLDIAGSLTVVGAGADKTVIDAAQLDRVFHVLQGASASLTGLTVTHGVAQSGGGIYNAGTLMVRDAAIVENATNGNGIALGGGIYSTEGVLTVDRALIAANFADFGGGGIAVDGFNDVTSITNSTISNNICDFIGGGIDAGGFGFMYIRNTTIANNFATFGGGLHGGITDVYVKNSLFANNTADLDGGIISEGYNLFSSSAGGRGYAPNDLLDVKALIGPLQDNGGPTWTHALYAQSPAIDAGDNLGAPVSDQRGQTRLIDGDKNGAARIDIGAFEYNPSAAGVAVATEASLGAAAAGQQFLVTSTADLPDVNPGDGLALASDGQTTLRAAIMEANALAQPVTIRLPAGLYLINLVGTDDAAAWGDFDVSGRITIRGDGANVTTIDAARRDRVFHVLPAAQLSLQGVTIAHGLAQSGGGIFNTGTLNVTASAILENAAQGSGWQNGGGIYNDKGTLTVTRSLIAGNQSGTDGGGIDQEDAFTGSASTTIIDSTIARNYATWGGGLNAGYNGTFEVRHSSVVNNYGTFGGGLHAGFDNITIKNSLVALNHRSDTDSGIISQGHNLFGSSAGGSNFDPTDLLNVRPMLKPLGNYGGTTWTHALLDDSAAVDAGDDAGAPATDQRGFLRIYDGDADGTATTDIGAYEHRAIADVVAPVVTLAVPDFTQDHTPPATVTASDGFGLPAGTAVLLDVDRNNDGDFADAGETGYATGTLTGNTAAFDVAPALTDGTYLVRARVSDLSENEGTSTIQSLVIDTVAPNVHLTTPAFTNDNTPTLSASASDTNGLPNGTPVVLDIDFTGDGDFNDSGETSYTQGLLLAGWTEFAVTPALPDGTFRVRTRVQDRAGNSGVSSTASFVVDTTGPTVTLSAASMTTDATPVVNITATDTNGLPYGTYVQLDVDLNDDDDFDDAGEARYTASTLVSGSATFELTPALATGDYKLQAVVSDRSGNQGVSAPHSINVNAVVPIVALNAPAITNDSTPRLTVTADEVGGLPASTNMYLDVDLNNDGDFADASEFSYWTGLVTGGTAQFDVSPALPDGMYHLRARVTGRESNQGASPVQTMIVDTTLPVVTLTAPQFTADFTPGVTIGVADLNPPADGALVWLDVDLNYDGDFDDAGETAYSQAPLGGGAATFDIAPALAEGLYYLRARGRDAAGNETASAVQRLRVGSATISGTKWSDVSGDGIWDSGEPGLAGVTIYLDLIVNGQLDAGEPTAVTIADDPETLTVDETGSYAFVNLPAGNYTVAEVLQADFRQTFPSPATAGGVHLLTLGSGQSLAARNFGNTWLGPRASAGGPYVVDEGGTVTLDGSSSSDPDGRIALSEWDLDADGEFDDAGGASAVFSAALIDGPGARTVGLRVTDNSGLVAETSVDVQIRNAPPVANAGGPYAVEVGQLVLLNGSATDPAGADTHTFAWDLDNDGQYDDLIGAQASFLTTAEGAFTIGLEVTDDDGAKSATTAALTVGNAVPTANAGGHYTVDEGSTLTLDGSASTDPTNDIVLYEWDLDGDGQYDDATGATTAFSRTADGTYTIGLRVTDDNGAIGTSQATVDVNNVAPTARAGGPYTVNEGVTLTLDASSTTDPGADIVSYAWDFDGDGQFDDATGVQVSYLAAADGAFTVRLRVSDDDDAASEVSATITVDNVAPTARAGGPYTVNEGSILELDGSTSSDPGNDITLYQWDLDNDGQYDDAVGAKVNFSSTVDGAHTVGLRVTDDRGASHSSAATVTVANVAPTVKPGGPYYVMVGTALALNGMASSDPGVDITTYEWDLNADGTFDYTGATASVPWSVLTTHLVPGALLNVRLRVSDSAGAKSTADTTVSIANVRRLGPVGYAERNNVALSGQQWYWLETTHAGYLTAAAHFAESTGVTLALYGPDVTQPALKAADAVTGGLRFDWSAQAAGERYYVSLWGASRDVDLDFVNLVSRAGDTATVAATDADDQYGFHSGAPHTVLVRDVGYQFDSAVVSKFVFNGGIGLDRLELQDSTGNDTLVFKPTEITLGNTPTIPNEPIYTFSGKGFETMNASAALGGTDIASLYDTNQQDNFTARAGEAQLVGGGYKVTVKLFDQVHGYALTDDGIEDTATLYDSPGNNKLKMTDEYTLIRNAGVYNRAKGFEKVVAYATAGGKDLAVFRGSNGNEFFKGETGKSQFYREVTESGQTKRLYDVTAEGFEEVLAWAGGGHDKAEIYDSPEADLFRGLGHKVEIGRNDGSEPRITARGFDEVKAFARNGAADIAKLYDTVVDDFFSGEQDWGKIWSEDQQYKFAIEIVAFERVKINGTTGVNKKTVGNNMLYLPEFIGTWV